MALLKSPFGTNRQPSCQKQEPGPEWAIVQRQGPRSLGPEVSTGGTRAVE